MEWVSVPLLAVGYISLSLFLFLNTPWCDDIGRYENKNPRSCVDFIVLAVFMRFDKTLSGRGFYLDVEQEVSI